MTQLAGWVVAAVCALVAAAVFVWQRRRIIALNTQVGNARRRLALLGEIAPPLTEAARESTVHTCERIVERLSTLIRAQTVLCFLTVDGRMVLGAKSDAGYAEFLRVGEVYEGDSIVDWSQRNHCAAIVGPALAALPPEESVVDMSAAPDGLRAVGPLVGSRDRVWAFCAPMMQHRGYGLRPAIIGAIYLERKHDEPFAAEDIQTAITVARLAGDALQRARFADEVKREAEVDQLTQMLTAATFRKRLREELETRRRDGLGKDIALFFIDTDRFKKREIITNART
ncbi:MAG: GGDEF domain-containing protein [Candidatus Eremiobacteraeota bacterium]|nr:GGDEF domain-containing protein [Candidatus Eremiobacteraeota bacterium]